MNACDMKKSCSLVREQSGSAVAVPLFPWFILPFPCPSCETAGFVRKSFKGAHALPGFLPGGALDGLDQCFHRKQRHDGGIPCGWRLYADLEDVPRVAGNGEAQTSVNRMITTPLAAAASASVASSCS